MQATSLFFCLSDFLSYHSFLAIGVTL